MKKRLRHLLRDNTPVPATATDQDMDIIKQAAVMCGAIITWEGAYDFRTFSSFHVTNNNELHGGVYRTDRIYGPTARWSEILRLSQSLVCPLNSVVGGI